MCRGSAGFEPAVGEAEIKCTSKAGVRSCFVPRPDWLLFLGGITVYQALYRKWRPRRFDDVVGQGHITETLKRQVESGRLSHAYLFTGTRGTGKTSCAKILARAVNCEAPEGGNPCNRCSACTGIESGGILDVLELDAASNNGVDHVRALRDEAIYSPAAVKKRVYIVDEVHMLSTQAFNALLKILEEPPAHLMFILATTELHKVPATIKSRCQQFSFKRIKPSDIIGQLQFIARQEGILLSEEGAVLLARLADGGLRDALSLLDQCIGGGEALKEADILQVLGLAGNLEMVHLLELIEAQDTAAALERLGLLYQEGKDMGALLGELSCLIRDILIRKTAAGGGESLLTGGYEDRVLHSFGERFTSSELAWMLSILQSASAELYRSSNRRTDVELCLIRLCERTLSTTPESLAARISRLEEQLAQSSSAPIPRAHKEAPTPSPVKEQDPPPWETAATDRASTSVALPPSDTLKDAAIPSPVAAAAPVASNDWRQFVKALNGKLPRSAYTFLGKAEFVSGIFETETLNIYVDSDMTKAILGKTEVLQAIAQEAETFAGRKLQVNLQLLPPNSNQNDSPSKDPFTDLVKMGKQFGNITIK